MNSIPCKVFNCNLLIKLKEGGLIQIIILSPKFPLPLPSRNTPLGMTSAYSFSVNYRPGSLTAISDAAGNLVESLSYDPWGRRRYPNNWNDYNVTSTMFDRGFTGHEHMPQFGLINPAALHCIALAGSATANFSLHSVCENQASADMNGRVYDPFLARFLSPDPFVQAPDYSQNYNRYSYAFNNPLKYTDPESVTLCVYWTYLSGKLHKVVFKFDVKIDFGF